MSASCNIQVNAKDKAFDRDKALAAPWVYSTTEVGVSLAIVVMGYLWGFTVLWELTREIKDPASLAGLEPGVLFDRPVDMFDQHWRMFSANLPYLLVIGCCHTACARAARNVFGPRHRATTSAELVMGLAYVTYAHGGGVVWVLSICAANFVCSRLSLRLRRSGAPLLQQVPPALTWASSLLVLFSLPALSRVRFAGVSPVLAWLDQYPGLYQWTVSFNLVLLRMISFNMDYHWATDPEKPVSPRPPEPTKGKTPKPAYRALQETPRPVDRYSLAAYLAYLFYPPLYLAGPVTPFNAWQAQIEAPQTAYGARDLLAYGARWLGGLALMQVCLHFNYANAICANPRSNHAILSSLTAPQVTFLSLSVIFFLWLKFLLIWRFFRLWALAAGVEAPENMHRCVMNNYSAQQFWRAWNRALHLWLLRYMYLPLGGRRYRAATVFLVFNFVAVWHALDWRLLHWAWAVCAILLPELAVAWAFSGGRFLALQGKWYYRSLCTLCGLCNVYLLIAANLVGFTFGLEGLRVVAVALWQNLSLAFVTVFVTSHYSAVNLMMYLRYGRQCAAVAKF